METRVRTCLRLLAALEALGEQEFAQLRAGDFNGARATRRNAEPLFASLGEMSGVTDGEVLSRARAVLAIRARMQAWLDDEVSATRDSLDRISSARQRLGRIAPAYRARGRSTTPQLCVRG